MAISKYYINGLLALLVVSTLMAAIGMMRKTSYYKPIKSKVKATNEIQKKKIDMWDNVLPLITQNDYHKINSSLTVKDTLGTQYKLETLTKGKYKLVFRYSWKDCGTCINDVIGKLNNPSSKYNLDNVILITDSFSDKDFRTQTRNKKFNHQIYTLLDEKLGLTLENKNFVFLFILTPDFRVTKIFVPLLETPKDTENYLTEMFAFINKENR